MKTSFPVARPGLHRYGYKSLFNRCLANSNVSYFLQKQKRINWRPSDGLEKKLDPGTAATPACRSMCRANSVSFEKPKPEISAMT